MRLAIYTRDTAGLIEFHGVQYWSSPAQLLEHYFRDDEPAEQAEMLGWPDTRVTWHGSLGYAMRQRQEATQ